MKVRNNAEGTTTTVSVKTGDGGTTSVDVSPKMSADSSILNLNFKPQK